MLYTIVYEAATGRIVSAVRDVETASDAHNSAEHQKLRDSQGSQPGMAVLEVDALPVGATKLRDCSVTNGVLTVTAEAAATNAKKEARRAAKQAAKADAKLEAFKDMTQQDWMNLSANDRWQTVFAVLKTLLPDE